MAMHEMASCCVAMVVVGFSVTVVQANHSALEKENAFNAQLNNGSQEICNHNLQHTYL